VNATSLLLEPLDAEQCAELMGLLSFGAGLDDDLRARITAASAGNPLFVEEMLAMVRDHGGDGEIVVPPTIHALLQARIDSLDGDVRLVMERGAVEGEVFHRGTVAELAPPAVRDGVATHLATLVRKELIRSTAPQFPEDEGFRFRHLLIRDAAYESLPKATRAELHERFADWLATHDLVERDEIVGYHVEQAHRYRRELDADDPELDALATRAARHLAAGGRAALDRGDYTAGRTLLARAAALFPRGEPERLALATDLAFALWESGELPEASRLLEEATSAADPIVAARATIVADLFDVLGAATRDADERTVRRDAARAVLERAGDHEGLSLYWWSVGGERWNRCRAEDAVAASRQGLFHAAESGVKGRTEDLTWWTSAAYVFGPTPVQEGIERLEELDRALGDDLLLRAGVWNSLSRLRAMNGDVDGGRDLHLRSRETFTEAGLQTTAASVALARAWIEERAGDFGAAEDGLRDALAELERLLDRGFLSTVAVALAECLYLRGAFDEAREMCDYTRRVTTPDDLINFVYVHAIESCLLAREGRFAEAERAGRRALELAESSDFFFARARGRLYLASALAVAGRDVESAGLASEGFAILDAKGDRTGYRWAEKVLDPG
jgi:tetratricopeptide (TPR) repeat protein